MSDGSGIERREQPGEDVFLGALLGLAIGDALGMPGGNGGRTNPEEPLTGYEALTRVDGSTVDAGEFTDESEIVLSIVEVATTDRGRLDADLIGYRLVRLALGESAVWQDESTRAALVRADETQDFQVPIDEDGPVSAPVAVRGLPVGLLASIGDVDRAAMRDDADLVTRLTHGSPAQANAVLAVAELVRLAAKRERPASEWAAATAELLGAGAMHDVLAGLIVEADPQAQVARLAAGSPEEQVAAGLIAAIGTDSFEAAVLRAAGSGGKADAIAAIAGGITGAWAGAGAIPQWLIDGLGGRIYVSLSAPWFRRAALYRAGVVRDLPMDGGGSPPPRPSFPPRQ
ncbi:MAG TPA: ADP-ribosylglycohydrolase family protein [Thermomicrobiales bacterium]|jgi:ADP-ribosyl-[dinitrogen reductase] hydrolase|nr:ADP-ribosylglycohydrolase family protein [Thermomicrobiales bacterium]